MSTRGKRPTQRTKSQQPVPAEVSAPPISVAEAGEGSDAPEPRRQEIARLAYSYWEARGCEGGSAEEDWLRAERELRT